MAFTVEEWVARRSDAFAVLPRVRENCRRCEFFTSPCVDHCLSFSAGTLRLQEGNGHTNKINISIFSFAKVPGTLLER